MNSMADALWTTAERDGWLVRLLTAGDDLTMPTDVEVVDPDGRTWVGTVATLAMIGSMMDSYRTTGECLAGTYAWVSDLLLVRDDSEATAFDSIFSLASTGEIDECFQRIEPNSGS